MEYFLAWIFVAAALLVSWFAGALIFSWSGHNENHRVQDFFFRLLTGIAALVLFYVLLKTGGRSSLLLMIVPGILVWWKNKKTRTGSFMQGITPPLKWMLFSFLLAGLVVFL